MSEQPETVPPAVLTTNDLPGVAMRYAVAFQTSTSRPYINLRASPPNGAVRTQIHVGALVVVLSYQTIQGGIWVKIAFDDYIGWISLQDGFIKLL